MPVNHLVVPIGVSHISSWLQEIQSREWEKRTKNKRTIGAWVISKCKKRSYVTLHSLCICRLSLTCSSCEISTSHEECWLILTGLPSLILNPISCWLFSSAIRCRLPFCVILRQLPSLSSFFQLPNWCSLAHFRSRRDLELRPLSIAPELLYIGSSWSNVQDIRIRSQHCWKIHWFTLNNFPVR